MWKSIRRGTDRTTLVTVTTGVLGQGVLVVSGVIVARLLGVNDRGQLAILVAIAVALAAVVSLGLPPAVSLVIARDRPSRRAIWSALQPLAVAQFLALMVLPAIAVAAIGTFSGAQLTLMMLLSPPAALASLAARYLMSILQGEERFSEFNWSRLLLSVPYALGIVIVLLLGGDSLGLIAAVWMVTSVSGSAAMLWITLLRPPRHEPRGSQAVSRHELAAFGSKALVGQSSPLENFSIDQIVIGAIGGPIVLGYYVIAYAFTNLPRFVAESLGMVAFPRVASRGGSGGARQIAKDVLVVTAVASLTIVVALELIMGWLIPFFFGSAFEPSVPVARILLISSFFFSLRRVLGDVLRGFGLPLPSTWAELVSWVVFGASVFPLVSKHGAEGAAVAYTSAAIASTAWVGFAALSVRGSSEKAIGASAEAVGVSTEGLVVQSTVIPIYRQEFVYGLIDRLDSRVEFLAGDRYFDAGIRTQIDARGRLTATRNHFLFGRRFLWQSGVLAKLARADVAVLEFNPRVLSNWPVLFARTVCRRRTLLWGHAWSRSGEGAVTNRIRLLMTMLSSGVIAYTETDRRSLAKRIGEDRVWVAPNSIDWVDAAVSAPFERPRNLVYSGRLSRTKKAELAIRAFVEASGSLPDEARFIVIGDGEQRPELEALVVQLGAVDRIDFRGPDFDPSSLALEYLNAVASVSPGYVGLSMVQSHCYGVPMIYSRAEPHAPEIESAIDGFNAVTFEADSVESLSSAIVDCFARRDEFAKSRNAIMQEARQRYSFESMLNGFESAVVGTEPSGERIGRVRD